jgi:hypothetical protein
LRGHNVFNSFFFLMIFSALNTSIRRLQALFKQQKQWIAPLGFGPFWTLKCYSCNWIIINEHLKDLTHMLYFQIPCYKLYKVGLLSYVLTLKNMCHFRMNWKKFNLKAKHNLKKKFMDKFLMHLILWFFTYLPT